MNEGIGDAVGAEWQRGINDTGNIPAAGCSFMHKTAIHAVGCVSDVVLVCRTL